MEHWHFNRKTYEDAESAHSTIYAALDAARDELRQLLDFHVQGITAMGDAGDFEGAYRAYQKSETYANVRDNIGNILRNHALPADSDERAPLYQAAWLNGTPEAADARLDQAAEHSMEMLNSETRLSMWHCVQDDVTVVTNDNTDTEGNLTEDGIPLYE